MLVQNVSALANALWQPERRDEARVRTLARMIALAKTKLLRLEAKRDEALAGRGLKAALVVEELIDGTARRLVAYLTEHRHAIACARPANVTAVAVQQATVVNVAAGR